MASVPEAQNLVVPSRSGNHTFYRNHGGYTGLSYTAGPQTFYRFSNGTSGYSLRAGSQTFCRYSDGSTGYTQRAGQSNFYRVSNPNWAWLAWIPMRPNPPKSRPIQ